MNGKYLWACKSGDLGLRKCERKAIITFLWKLMQSHKGRRDIVHMLRTVSWQNEDLAHWHQVLKFRKMWSSLLLGTQDCMWASTCHFMEIIVPKLRAWRNFFHRDKKGCWPSVLPVGGKCCLKGSYSMKNRHFQIYTVKDYSESQ